MSRGERRLKTCLKSLLVPGCLLHVVALRYFCCHRSWTFNFPLIVK